MEKTSFLKEPVGGQSVVNKIVDNITNAIINGELNPGDKILQKQNCQIQWGLEEIRSGKPSRC